MLYKSFFIWKREAVKNCSTHLLHGISQLMTIFLPVLFFGAVGEVKGQIGGPLPDYDVACGNFQIIIQPQITPPCQSCCVQPSCTQAVYQVRLAISPFGLPLGAYNNGNFDLLYDQLTITVQALVNEGGLTKINKKATEDCMSGVIGGSNDGSLFRIVASEDENSASLDLNTSYIGEPGEVLPVVTFQNYQTGVLFSLVVDFYPGEPTGALPTSFQYVDSNGVPCTSFSVTYGGGPSQYPSPANANLNYRVSLGTSICTIESACFPVEMPSAAGGVDLLDFSVTVASNTHLAQKPAIQVTPGQPTPIVEYEKLPNDGGYAIHFTYENTTIAGGSELFKICAEPELFTGGYDMTASISVGRLIVGGGNCDRPAVGNNPAQCSQTGLPSCSDYTLTVQTQSAGFGQHCNELKVYTSLAGPLEDFDELNLRIDFILDAGVTLTNASLDNMTCPSGCMVTFTPPNIVELNSTVPINWSSNSFLLVEFDAPNGCVQDAWVRKAEIKPHGSPKLCYPTVSKVTFPYCTNQIAGHIATELHCYVEDVTVRVYPEDDPQACEYHLLTDCGPYSQCVCAGYDKWAIVPTKDDERLNGVTTIDLVCISQHILGSFPLLSPYYMIAADANMSGSITTFDIVSFRKLILGIYNDDDMDPSNDWPANYARSWRFVPKSFTFPNQNNPFQSSFPESLNGQTLPTLDADFVAIKVGHALNANFPGNQPPVVCNDCTAPRPSFGRFELSTPAMGMRLGEHKTIPIYAQGDAPLMAWQMGINFDKEALEFVGVSQGDLPGLKDDNFGLTEVSQGKIRALWMADLTDEDDYTRPGQKLFYITLRAKRNIINVSKLLSIDDNVLQSIGWQNNNAAYRLEINPESKAGERDGMDMGNTLKASCRPNPSMDEFAFDVDLSESSQVRLTVYDAFGRRMLFRQLSLDAGQQSIQVSEASLWPAGVYRWDIRAGKDLSANGHAVKQ